MQTILHVVVCIVRIYLCMTYSNTQETRRTVLRANKRIFNSINLTVAEQINQSPSHAFCLFKAIAINWCLQLQTALYICTTLRKYKALFISFCLCVFGFSLVCRFECSVYIAFSFFLFCHFPSIHLPVRCMRKRKEYLFAL